MIDKNEVRRIYSLAKLNIDDRDLDIMKNKFNIILDFANIIMEVDTKNIEMMELISNHESILREDIVEDSIDRDIALKNCKEKEFGYFRLKKVVE